MALSVGTRLGLYEIVAPIGAGGMGEVYEARDTRLERSVAIKILPDELSSDSERVARFEREAKLLAALNHPNVATLHGLEESDGRRFLVMELVAGETLAERIARGRIPVAEACARFLQIAEGLEAAHEKGIVHRDLKPANIKIAPDGNIKILDFGLAKAFSPENDVAAEASQSPTLTRGTALGAIMGTASYMSPEQARGKSVDKRTDIWAFGCCLYEALTAKKAFDGDTVSDIISNVLRVEPSWDKMPVELVGLARRCLVKDPRDRIRDIGDVRIELSRNGVVATAPAPGSRAVLIGITALVAATLGVIVGTRLASTPEAAPAPLVRFTIDEPPAVLTPKDQASFMAITRDGHRLAYLAESAGTRQLFVREMDQANARPIPGTEDALGPFFSPDGQWLGYFYDEALWKISLEGGAPVRLASAPQSRGASWGENGSIVFSGNADGPLLRVPAEGGDAEPLTVLDSKRGERTHRWPDVLPGGHAVLFTIGDDRMTTFDDAKIAVHSIETGETRVLIDPGTHARYVPSGHIVYGRGGALLAAPFDLRSLELVGPPVNVLDDVASFGDFGAAVFALSDSGTLAYLRGGAIFARRGLIWVDRNGSEYPVPTESTPNGIEISPDGRLVALDVNEANSAIWIHELERGTTSRLTFQGNNVRPVWSPDGSRIAFASNEAPHLFVQDVDHNWAPEAVGRGIYFRYPYSMSPDGRRLAFTELHPETQQDIRILSLDSEEETVFASEAFNESLPEFSPDGKWIAYVSDENGRNEVFVQPYPGPGKKRQVSTEGGRAPLWSPNGQEIFYRAERAVMAVSFTGQPDVRIGRPRELFEDRFYRLPAFPQAVTYDVAPDGRFLMIEEEDPPDHAPVEVVVNWTEELKRLAPR